MNSLPSLKSFLGFSPECCLVREGERYVCACACGCVCVCVCVCVCLWRWRVEKEEGGKCRLQVRLEECF